jgi:hypothetical protein
MKYYLYKKATWVWDTWWLAPLHPLANMVRQWAFDPRDPRHWND